VQLEGCSKRNGTILPAFLKIGAAGKADEVCADAVLS